MGLFGRVKERVKRSISEIKERLFWRAIREDPEDPWFLRKWAERNLGLPEWAGEKIVEHNITHVFDEQGQKKHILDASKGEIAGEVFVRDYLRWVARRAGQEELDRAVLEGRYMEKEIIDRFREADKMAFSRALRELVAERATIPNETEVREMLELYQKIVFDPELAMHVREALENNKVELPREIVEKKGLQNIHRMERALQLMKEGMASGILWKPPGWKIKTGRR